MPSLRITPANFEVWMKPGATYIQSYQIQNTGPSAITLSSSIERWLPQGFDGGINYLGLPIDLNISLTNSDLKLGDTFILNPGQSRQLVLKIKIPPNFIPQDRYFTLFLRQQPSLTNTENIQNTIQIGSHLLISISNSEKPVQNITVTNFKLFPLFHDSIFDHSSFSALIENQSDFFLKTEGEIIITKNNQPISTLLIFPSNVLARHQRSILCLNNDQPQTCQPPKPLWPGIYQAKLILKDSSSSASLSFLVLPYFIIIPFTTILLTVLLWKYIRIYLAKNK